jgi:NAD(P)-dependent dehydrogenase (short-subunit alcohol dehydrogenase family)
MVHRQELVGQSALVTGGNSGIGRATVSAFLEAGAGVVSLDLSHQETSGYRAADRLIEIKGSVFDRSAVGKALALGEETFGPLSIAVANAGMNHYTPYLDLTDAIWSAHIETDLTGVFVTTQMAARAMAAVGGGSIIVVTSISAERPASTQIHYCAAKAGAQMLALGMAWELAKYGIRVNTVGPGWVNTALTQDYLADQTSRAQVEATIPLGRVGEPEDVANAILFLASERASFITGAHLRIDGGMIAGKDKT